MLDTIGVKLPGKRDLTILTIGEKYMVKTRLKGVEREVLAELVGCQSWPTIGVEYFYFHYEGFTLHIPPAALVLT